MCTAHQTTQQMQFNKTILLTLALFIAAAFAALPGQKLEYKGEPTKDMRKAIELVLSHMGDIRGHKQVLTKIDRIQQQVVAGRNYFLDIRVRSEHLAEHAVAAIVLHKLDDTMEVSNVNTGVRMDSLNHDQRRGLFAAMIHLEKMYKQSIELIMIKSVQTQVVSGVIYHYDLSFRGQSWPMREEKLSVHKSWTGEWVVVEEMN
jgi:hypothetical protein